MSTEPTMQERLDRLDEEKARVSLGGGQDKIEKQHERGKLTARSINALVDEDTFQRPACLPPTAPRTSEWIRPRRLLTVW